MATNLQTPILNNRTRSVNFFNGRLLTGEDLTAEQQANRAARNVLGYAIGSGVVQGLEVTESVKFSSVQTPVLTVTKGLALNYRGAPLLLADDTDIALVRPANTSNGSTTIFQDCVPVQSGVYVAGAGVYLLTVGPASAPEGLAEVSGISTGAAPCNINYTADGVQFRLIQLDLTPAELSDTNHLQNLVAYKCFALADWDAVRADQFGLRSNFGIIDQLRAASQLTECEAPLAVLYWTASAGLVFIDQWSVRRRITKRPESARWPLSVNDDADSDAEAAFLQFQAQLTMISRTVASSNTVAATTFFRYLPAAGVIPAFTVAPLMQGFDYTQFFNGITYRNPVFINGARLETVLRDSLRYRPIDLNSGELIRLYLVRENRQPLPDGTPNPAQPYIVFVTGHAPYYGDAHYNVARWDYGNYF